MKTKTIIGIIALEIALSLIGALPCLVLWKALAYFCVVPDMGWVKIMFFSLVIYRLFYHSGQIIGLMIAGKWLDRIGYEYK